VRCSVAARSRGDELVATAPPARRFLLVEVPGSWVPDVWAAAGLSLEVTLQLQAVTAAWGMRLVLIRRPGRHPAGAEIPRRWAVVARDAGARWGSWLRDADLMDLDVAAELTTLETPSGTDGDSAVASHSLAVAPDSPRPLSVARPLVLVCTHGRHDVCCAIEGRPVVSALSGDPRLDVWECSHLGGDRFAANILWLPSGLLFGGLTAGTAWAVAEAALTGRVVLEHFRGRCGDAPLAQAAQWHLMRALGEERPGAVEILGVERPDAMPDAGPSVTLEGADGTAVPPLAAVGEVVPRAGQVLTVIARHAGRRYRLDLVPAWTQPHHLTCRAPTNARMRTFVPAGQPSDF
jgi:hypothetical protein